MGLIWDLIQQGQIRESSDRAASLETRVFRLEEELRKTNEVLMTLLRTLEQRFGEDLDRDGRVGSPRRRRRASAAMAALVRNPHAQFIALAVHQLRA